MYDIPHDAKIRKHSFKVVSNLQSHLIVPTPLPTLALIEIETFLWVMFKVNFITIKNGNAFSSIFFISKILEFVDVSSVSFELSNSSIMKNYKYFNLKFKRQDVKFVLLILK